MRSTLPAEAYIDEAWFVREREALMRPLWQFVAPRMLLAKHNGFVTRSVCGVEVVVQNFNGELRAFENICLHRQNPLQYQAHGVRPLVCSYHGWGYRDDGAVDNIPFQDTAYRLPAPERECLKLRRFPVECIGNLVFVNVGSKPVELHEQFSMEALASLRSASEHFDSEVLIATLPTKLNWKLAYENLRDSLHPRYLHQQSVYQQVKFQVQMDENAVTAAKSYHASGSIGREAHLAHLRAFSNGDLTSPLFRCRSTLGMTTLIDTALTIGISTGSSSPICTSPLDRVATHSSLSITSQSLQHEPIWSSITSPPERSAVTQPPQRFCLRIWRAQKKCCVKTYPSWKKCRRHFAPARQGPP